MARLYYNQEQFNFGWLGKHLRSRRDGKFYKSGAKVMTNYRPSIQGPAFKRKGTVHVTEIKDSDATYTRLIPFIFNETDSYDMEFGNLYIRFFQNGDSVFLTAQNITNITQANPAVVTYDGSDTYANGDEVEINSVVGMTQVNGKRFRVAGLNAGANTFQLTDVDGNNVNSTAYTAYSSGGTVKEVYELVSPYATADLDNIKYDQIGDIMYLTVGGKSIRPQKLTRTSSTSWTIANLDNQLGPVQDVNETTTTITLSGTLTKSGTSTWTASAAIFNASHVGSVWAIAKSTDTAVIGYARMAGFTSTTVATFTNQTDLTPVTVTATLNWYEAAWSDVRGYPYGVAFHEDRLFFAGTDLSPLDVYGSVANGVYENYDTGTGAPDDGLRFQLAGQLNLIRWLLSDGEFLIGGSLGGLSFVSFNITETTIVPRARSGGSFGASSIQGIKLSDQLVYLHSNNKNLYEAEYDDLTLKYRSIDLNDINPDALAVAASELIAVEQPDVSAAMVSNGDLILLSRDNTQEIVGWYKYEIGQGTVESISVKPSAGDDTITLIVKRTINGVTRRYIEYIDNTTAEIWLDSSITITGAATRTFTGLNHLEGETVSVRGDDSYAGDYEVTSGSITIPDSKTAIEEAIIGLPYNADIEIMPIDIEVPNTGGTTQTLLSRVNEIHAVLSETIGMKIGSSFDDLRVVPFRNVNSQMTSPPDIFGETYPDVLQIPFSSQNWTRSPTICFRHDLPFNSIICSLMARLEVNSN